MFTYLLITVNTHIFVKFTCTLYTSAAVAFLFLLLAGLGGLSGLNPKAAGLLVYPKAAGLQSCFVLTERGV
jgi:hypothetical protein